MVFIKLTVGDSEYRVDHEAERHIRSQAPKYPAKVRVLKRINTEKEKNKGGLVVGVSIFSLFMAKYR